MDIVKRIRLVNLQSRAQFTVSQRRPPEPTTGATSRYDRTTGRFSVSQGAVTRLASPVQNKALPVGRVVQLNDGVIDYL
ncbi:MAG: hypothetical protein AAF151_12080 [Cyanobacteria bacterium J06656_5]